MDIVESDSIQIAQQKLRSIRSNLAWETCGLEKAIESIDQIKANIITYYKIKNR